MMKLSILMNRPQWFSELLYTLAISAHLVRAFRSVFDIFCCSAL